MLSRSLQHSGPAVLTLPQNTTETRGTLCCVADLELDPATAAAMEEHAAAIGQLPQVWLAVEVPMHPRLLLCPPSLMPSRQWASSPAACPAHLPPLHLHLRHRAGCKWS